MPYVKQELRTKTLNDLVYELCREIREMSGYGAINLGLLNFTITNLLDYLLAGETQLSYDRLNSFIGVLESIKLELYRRVVAPYEDKQLKANGEVFTGAQIADRSR